MKVVGLVSGGKDSCYAMMKCIEYGHEIVALANLMPADDSVDELDSYMYQTVGHQIIVSYAECMRMPLFRRRIKGSTRHQHLNYQMTPGDEVEDLYILLSEVKKQIPSINAVSSGAIASDYQRLRVENICSRLGLVSLAYLWKQDQSLLLRKWYLFFSILWITKDVAAIIVKVAAMGLTPTKHLGKNISDMESHLLQLKKLYGINVCGEGGEYETLTLDCPLFTNAQIVLDDFQLVLHSQDSIAQVGILHPLSFHLEHKKESHFTDTGMKDDLVSINSCYIHEAENDSLPEYFVRFQSLNTVTCLSEPTDGETQISRTNRDTYSLGCWIQNSSKNCEDLQKDLVAVLNRIESQLKEDGLDWENVLYIHLYIADMNDFSLANETYVKFITENKCHFGVPSRSTIELPLTQAGFGKAFVEVLVSSNTMKKVLHVQSISCWAPSCIGPYSQATMHKGILLMAGQLGLDPPTMVLCSGGAISELEQALKNCDAVAKNFNCNLLSSVILFVIYCSSSLNSSERIDIENWMKNYKGQEEKYDSLQKWEWLNPVFLYVLAPNLPKAFVEVKPVLYIPNGEDAIVTTEIQNCTKMSDYWGFKHSEWHDSCFQKCIIHGKICIAVLSITTEVISKLCEDLKPAENPYCYSGDHMKRISGFCIYLFDRILLENGFCWEDLMTLRFYFSTELELPMEMLSSKFTESFNELAEITGRTEKGKEPLYNLIPVLGSGSSMDMSDIITCELFASKL